MDPVVMLEDMNPEQIEKLVHPKQLIERNKKITQKPIAFTLNAEDYFELNSSKKCITSNNKLDKLKSRFLDNSDSVKYLSKEHDRSIKHLTKQIKVDFDKWLKLLLNDFNLLLYGLGSKKQILCDFLDKKLINNYTAVFVNGFFPSLMLKDILDNVLDALDIKISVTNVHEIVDSIEKFIEKQDDLHLFLIINNIDGEMLRDTKTQNVLSKLASVKNIHLICSIDHINAPLIWDNLKLSNFNFIWCDTTTFLAYDEETAFEGSLLDQKSEALTLSSLRNIFKSLTKNARGVFNIIVKKQLENSNDSNYQGLAFKDLYWACREEFLVSSDAALRAQLTEFLDHKILKSKRNLEGIELLIIPIKNQLLSNFIDEIK